MSKDKPSHELTNSKGDFPRNSRFFPAGFIRFLPRLAQITLLWSALITFVLINAAIQKRAQSASVLGAIDDQSEQTTSQKRYEILQKQYAYWQTVVSNHPDYRDGYYALAVLAYKLGQTADAVNFLRQVQSIDPNFVDSDRLQSVLEPISSSGK